MKKPFSSGGWKIEQIVQSWVIIDFLGCLRAICFSSVWCDGWLTYNMWMSLENEKKKKSDLVAI